MSESQERIAEWRKMAMDDPENELGHYRLGRALLEAGEYDEAIQSFRRTLDLSPEFSRVYQLLANCYRKKNQTAEAVETLKKGYAVAVKRGDYEPRDEMARMLTELGEPVPQTRPAAEPSLEGVGGFRCQRPGCMWGARARQLPKPPLPDEVGQRIYQSICAECWNEWVRNFSIKVINELRLDLSTERGQEEYDRYMREFFGLD
jgi:Fe-S cluster biosynthesis and repair protein YggX